MNTAEKLRFLADRAEDGKEFNTFPNYVYKIVNNKLLILNDFGEYQESILRIGDLLLHELKLKPQWSFTEDEKVILRNLPAIYKWIARHKSGYITIHKYKPCKHNNGLNWLDFEVHDNLSQFEHLFQSIQWSDDEPCEFREYL